MALLQSVRSRLTLLSLIGTVGMVAVLAAGLVSEYRNLSHDREVKTRQLVESAHTLIAHYQAQEAQGVLTRQQAQQAARSAVKALRYEGKEYFWINDMTPVMIMHPLKPELDGKPLGDFKDPDGKRLFVEFVDVVRQNQAGFVHYQWPKPGADAPQPKLSYVKGFEPWGWIVGSGIYMDDLQDEFVSRAVRAGALVALIALLGLTFARLIARSVLLPLQAMEAAMGEVARSHDLTRRVEHARQDEIGHMGRSFNTMMEGFQTLVRDMARSSREVGAAAQQLSSASSSVADASQEQSQSAMSTSAAVEQMSGSIARVSERDRKSVV